MNYLFIKSVKRKYKLSAEVDKAWFGRSVVTENGKPGGKPLLVHRGEHGDVADLSTKVGSLTFSDWEAAKTYATEPNDQNDTVKDSRIHHAYLKLENPIFKDPDDPFVDLNVLEAKMGKDFLILVAKKHGDWITETNAWEENGQDKYEAGDYKSVVDFLNKNPDTLDKLCVQIYPLLDDEELVKKMEAKGYDGAIHGSTAETLDSMEYRVFDKNQIRLVKTERLQE